MYTYKLGLFFINEAKNDLAANLSFNSVDPDVVAGLYHRPGWVASR